MRGRLHYLTTLSVFIAACGASPPPAQSHPTSSTDEAGDGQVEPQENTTPAPQASTNSGEPARTMKRALLVEQVAALLPKELCTKEEHPVRFCYDIKLTECQERIKVKVFECESLLPELVLISDVREASYNVSQCAANHYSDEMGADGRRKTIPRCNIPRADILKEANKEVARGCADPQSGPRRCFDVTEQECIEGFAKGFEACAELMPELVAPHQTKGPILTAVGECAGKKFQQRYESRHRPCEPSPARSAN